ncbi:MAG: aminotransferase class IV [Lutisporaceae bacterium]
MFLYYNNNLIDDEAVTINPSCQGFQFGLGVFETILVLEGKPCFMELHFERLMQGCKKLGLQLVLEAEQLKAQAQALISRNNIKNGRLKLLCFRDIKGISTLITVSDYDYKENFCEEGYDICLSEIRRNPHSPMPYIKSLNYGENILTRERAINQGYQEALFMNVYDRLCEGTISNIFWIKDNIVFTPEISCGILNGITRSQVIQLCRNLKLELHEGSYKYEELLEAEEVFITNSLIDIMPISKVENYFYNISDYKITRKLYAEYKNLIKHS